MTALAATFPHPLDMPLPGRAEHRSAVPHVPASHAQGNMESGKMSADSIQPKLRGAFAKTRIREEVATALASCGETKEIARLADAAPPTVDNWRTGRNTMSLAHFVRLAREHPGFKAFARRLLQLEASLDPEFEQFFLQAMQKFSEMKRGRE